MTEKSRQKKFDDFEDDLEATEIEMKGVAYTGLSVQLIVLGLIVVACYAIW